MRRRRKLTANGLQHHRARYYAPGLAVWTALDPWEGLHERPMSLNGYSWVEGNVPNLTDASGEGAGAALLTAGVIVIAALALLAVTPVNPCVPFWRRDSECAALADAVAGVIGGIRDFCLGAIEAALYPLQPQTIPQAPPQTVPELSDPDRVRMQREGEERERWPRFDPTRIPAPFPLPQPQPTLSPQPTATPTRQPIIMHIAFGLNARPGQTTEDPLLPTPTLERPLLWEFVGNLRISLNTIHVHSHHTWREAHKYPYYGRVLVPDAVLPGDFDREFEEVTTRTDEIHFNLEGIAGGYKVFAESGSGYSTFIEIPSNSGLVTARELYLITSRSGLCSKTKFYEEGSRSLVPSDTVKSELCSSGGG